MFERFTEKARQVLIHAQEEARTLGHHHIGAEHLLLGVVRVEPAILPAGPDDIRARIGPGPGSTPQQIPFTPGAKSALERASRHPDAMGHAAIAPAHLLLALADEPEAILAAGATPEAMRTAALRRLAAAPVPRHKRFDLDATIAEGGPIPVWLGDHELPIGDLGHPRVDAKVLLAMLARDGRSAALLRQHGLDEGAVRGALGGL
jgi:hypothetical protein